MGTLGFSYVGLFFILMLIIPNLIWAKRQPVGYNPKNENKILVSLERIGQVCVTGTVLIFEDSNFKKWSLWYWCFLLACLFMILYEC